MQEKRNLQRVKKLVPILAGATSKDDIQQVASTYLEQNFSREDIREGAKKLVVPSEGKNKTPFLANKLDGKAFS